MEDRITASIHETLQRLEQDEDIIVLLAVESGSRAWGFPSTDSDYDVRFIYVHRPEWYLSIDLENCRDVIEQPLKAGIDLSGWDIRKALKLFHRSNPPLLEWLQCPIVYHERFSFANRLRNLLPDFYSPKATFYHYLHMAKGNIREYLRGDTVWRKKYFYVLRPLLAMRWIDQGRGPVPIEFQKLVDATLNDPVLIAAIRDLVSAKMAGAELDQGPRIPAISDFITVEMTRLEQTAYGRPDVAPEVAKLNELFRVMLYECWNGSS